MTREELKEECINIIKMNNINMDTLIDIYDLLIDDIYDNYEINKRHCFYCGKDSLIKLWGEDEECPNCGVRIKEIDGAKYYEEPGGILTKRVNEEENLRAAKIAYRLEKTKLKREAKEKIGVKLNIDKQAWKEAISQRNALKDENYNGYIRWLEEHNELGKYDKAIAEAQYHANFWQNKEKKEESKVRRAKVK